MCNKINLLNFDRCKMKNFFCSIGEKTFSSDQVMMWIYHNFCHDFNKMTNISIKLRKKLQNMSIIKFPKFVKQYNSIDGTIKWLVNVDNQIIETVYIPEKKRGTLCISSQVGCILNCHFCATGQQKFIRNLLVSEIIGQVWMAKKKINEMKNYPKITNIVMMGMGEPLLNLNNVVVALKIMSDNLGFNISKKKITISTSGIIPALQKLPNMIDVKLALSLHAPNDIVRNQIMPINKKYNIISLLKTVSKFLKKSKVNKKGITIEYVMLHQINDTLFHAQELIKILQHVPNKINLIPWNNFQNSKFLCSTSIQIEKFSNFLINKGFLTTIRKPRGQDIRAACGQLTGIIVK
ncbi:23S rRNA (adenine(2503)-C(2))-methyltransferase RlmN [Buchnera aphidicola]|uniref:Dual-specificity RNA methyltransferase RlmN n=1 Tax=Buchnera aphidicola (Stegophylla sp.) TaxID=2315800 RepID=A0A4D6YAA0_9GAMM|nr:23S rRNA (adenine(2503)-C(2))-methyltransferase RlmN [Buchnera aphidicola (Stegophylla sp.)]QCI26359.1 23S rRNA (adenine(2503)-C(2))-methyltransferase RlmN [Buchnera aphidicola (Stegophylla sp.)]